jgi:hypothetical protein
VKKTLESWTISRLIGEIDRIEFPEFQREPTVWGLEKKKRLIDSILRGIDISLIYFAKNKEEDTFDCIDGRQRINAILSYLGINKNDEDHNAFHLDMENEIYDDSEKWKDIAGMKFDRLKQLKPEYSESILNYALNIMTVEVEETDHPDQLNLMFLRLQLGSPLRGGEKLHAMSGAMRSYVFNELSKHQYFVKLSIPQRRFAKELVAAQLLRNVYSYLDVETFSRSRFEDLQAFFRKYSKMGGSEEKRNKQVEKALDQVVERMGGKICLIKNRGLAVSAFLFIWSELILQGRMQDIGEFGNFLDALVKALKIQVEKAKRMDIDPKYRELLNLQTSLTQATGDTSSLQMRQAFFSDYFDHFLKTKAIKVNQ